MKNIIKFPFTRYCKYAFHFVVKCFAAVTLLLFCAEFGRAEYLESDDASSYENFKSYFLDTGIAVNADGKLHPFYYKYAAYSQYNPLDSSRKIIENWNLVIQSDYNTDLLTPSLDITPPDPEKMPDEISPLQNVNFLSGVCFMQSVTLSHYMEAFSAQLRNQLRQLFDSLSHLKNGNVVAASLIPPDISASFWEDVLLWTAIAAGALLSMVCIGLLIWDYFSPDDDFTNSPIDYNFNKNYYMPIE